MKKIWGWIKQRIYRIGSTIAIFLIWRRIKHDPYRPPLWEIQTELYIIKGNIGKARKTINTALKLFPDDERLLAKLEKVEKCETMSQSI